MEKHDYIKAIEKLNREQIKEYYSAENRKYREKRKVQMLLRSGQYRRAFQTVIGRIRGKFKKSPIPEIRQYHIMENKIDITHKKKVVYTYVTKGYDIVYSPLIITDNTDYVLFSDSKIIMKGLQTWQFREVPDKVRELCKNNEVLINRYIKMHAKELFPDYEYALYVDGSVRIISDVTKMFQRINPKTGLGMHVHRLREDVYEEAKACIRINFGNKKKIRELIQRYQNEGVPTQYGLFEATIIAIDLTNPHAKTILENWWKEFFCTETYRDQLTFTYVLWKQGYQFQDVGILGENIEKNPIFRRQQHVYPRRSLRKEIKKMKAKIQQSRSYILLKKRVYDNYVRPFHMRIKKIFYYGKKYQCNLCESNVRKMFPHGIKHEVFHQNHIIGAGYVDHVKCPVCRAKDIERMTFYYIQHYTNLLTAPNTVLQFSPGVEMKRRIKKNKQVVYFEGEIESKVDKEVIDITNTPFQDNQFDYIICNHILQQVIEEEKGLLELKRIIKPKGEIIITAPICISNETTMEDKTMTSKEERLYYYGQGNYVRLYGRDFLKRLQGYGFHVREYDFEAVEGKEKSKTYGMLEKGCIYIATKE